MQIQLPDKAYNDEKLDQELQTVATYDSLMTIGTDTFALISDDAQQSDQDAVINIATNHDETQTTDDQRALATAQAVIAGINTSIKIFPEITTLYQLRAQYLTAPPGTYTVVQSYNAFRTVMDSYATGTPNQQIAFALIINYAREHKNIDYLNPPDPITDAYRCEVLDASYQIIASITLQFVTARGKSI